eukprot:CAMPEP_0178938310 /NCGR_PEP_ID=MMETSP0786-20121207/26259_1 /TAXON_ID=186022 /ORGANISM="Thalassionema frauenfeldii, Strain CCMP 1798" /LENGTH=667 /DNA_ID=CAMNT_0020617013 /DNA_START=256 /DNA_END=2259 /DNA_ORIENTATION=+
MPFEEVHQEAHAKVFADTTDHNKPTWIPSPCSPATNIQAMMAQKGFQTYQELYEWSIQNRNEFWMESAKMIGVVWKSEPSSAFDLSGGAKNPQYFPGGKLNITDSCFHPADMDKPAIIYNNLKNVICTRSYQELNDLTSRVASALVNLLGPSPRVAICMPMTPECVACYLGIIKAGGTVLSIADSFSSAEIATRCQIGQATAIITQDVISRGEGTKVNLCKRVQTANEKLNMKMIVLPALLHSIPVDWSTLGCSDEKELFDKSVQLCSSENFTWFQFLQHADSSGIFQSINKNPMEEANLLFSSGTTGTPKAIVWNHSTPIKCAIDGYYHFNLSGKAVVAWPTNVGWMMGPWLVYQLLNQVTIALHCHSAPTSWDFLQFVKRAKVTMLGVIPSLVKRWRRTCPEVDLGNQIETFGSTGEASDPSDMFWLMSRVQGYAPVMEYCGGTELGGSYLSSTLLQPNIPSLFSTPVLGSKLFFLPNNTETNMQKDNNAYNLKSGEVALIPPSIGWSTTLLNRSHEKEYFSLPHSPEGEILRQHGDEMELLEGGYYRAMGRCDDTMNLGGIKVGSAEIERVCNQHPGIQESAAIAVGSPSKLILFVVTAAAEKPDYIKEEELQRSLYALIKQELNPLFRVTEVIARSSLPRTASNKIMRRLLRDEYYQNNKLNE